MTVGARGLVTVSRMGGGLTGGRAGGRTGESARGRAGGWVGERASGRAGGRKTEGRAVDPGGLHDVERRAEESMIFFRKHIEAYFGKTHPRTGLSLLSG